MINLLKAEKYKLIHSWYFWGMVAFSLVLGSILLFDSNKMTADFMNASLYNTPLLYFITIIFAVFFIGADFENWTLNYYVSAGHKRSSVILAKALSYAAASIIILAVPITLHSLLDVILGKDGDLYLPSFLFNLLVILAALLAMILMPFLFAFLFKDIGKTLVVPMALYFVMIFLLNSDEASLAAVIFPMGQLRLLSLQELPIPKIAVIGIDAIWILTLYFGAFIRFCHTDLK